MDIHLFAEKASDIERLQDALRVAEAGCNVTKIYELASGTNLSEEMSASHAPDVGFLSFDELTENHIPLIKEVRSNVPPDCTLVVISRVPDHSTVFQAVRAGVNDFLCYEDDLNREIAGLLSRLKLDQVRKNPRGRIITIVPCDSPSDANLLSLNLAAIVSQHIGKCGLLDFHFRGADLAILLKLSPAHTMLDLASRPDSLDETMLQQAICHHDSGIQLLAGPPPFSDLSKIRVHACQQIVSLSQQSWPMVIINAEDIQHAEQIRALAMSDEILLTMRLDIASLHRAQHYIGFLLNNQTDRERVHVVAMATGHGGELSLSAAKKCLQVNHLHSIPDDPEAIITSVNLGTPLVHEHPRSKITAAIKELANAAGGAAFSAQGGTPIKRNAVKAAAWTALSTFALTASKKSLI